VPGYGWAFCDQCAEIDKADGICSNLYECPFFSVFAFVVRLSWGTVFESQKTITVEASEIIIGKAQLGFVFGVFKVAEESVRIQIKQSIQTGLILCTIDQRLLLG
jgi:hypothetical protein